MRLDSLGSEEGRKDLPEGKVCLEFQVDNKVISLETLHLHSTKVFPLLRWNSSEGRHAVFIKDEERFAEKLKRKEQINQKSFPVISPYRVRPPRRVRSGKVLR